MKKYNDDSIYPKEWTTKKLKDWIVCYYNTTIKNDGISQYNKGTVADDIGYLLTLINELRSRSVGVTTSIKFY